MAEQQTIGDFEARAEAAEERRAKAVVEIVRWARMLCQPSPADDPEFVREQLRLAVEDFDRA